MMKHLTVLILALGLLNPFCCCFASSSDSETEPSAPQRISCCQQLPDDIEGSIPDTPAPCENCPCDKSFAVADAAKDAAKLGFKEIEILESVALSEVVLVVQVPAERLGFVMRPPPPPGARIHLVHCVFRT